MFKAVYLDVVHLPRWQYSGYVVSFLHPSSCGCDDDDDDDVFQTEGTGFYVEENLL
jgi:hypothetical protein